MKINMKQIKMITWFTEHGMLTPLRFQMQGILQYKIGLDTWFLFDYNSIIRHVQFGIVCLVKEGWKYEEKT